MTTGQKASFSLLITLIVFSAFIVLFHSGFFSVFEKNFYSRIKIQEKESELEKISLEFNNRVDDILDSIYRSDDAYLKSEDVKSYLKFEPTEYEIAGRRHRTEELFYKYEGLRGLRLIDDLQYICYSSFSETDLSDDKEYALSNNYQRYKRYSEVIQKDRTFSLENLKSKTNSPKFLVDSRNNYLIIAIPFSPLELSDTIGAIKSGTFVFYFDASVFENELVRKNILRIGDRFSAVSTPKDLNLSGFIVYSDVEEIANVKNAVLHQWKMSDSTVPKTGRYYAENLFTQSDGKVLAMLFKDVCRYVKISGVYDSRDFKLPAQMITLLYLCLFLTFLLVSFFLLSHQVDYAEVIKRRIKKIQMEIISQYLDDKTEIDWRRFANQLSNKKEELSEDIKKSFGRKGLRYSAEIDALLDKSWDEIISVLKKTGEAEGENSVLEEVKALLEEVLFSGSIREYKNKSSLPAQNAAGFSGTGSDSDVENVPVEVSVSDAPVMHEYTIMNPPEHPVLLDVEAVIPEKVSVNSDVALDLNIKDNTEYSDLTDLDNDDDDYKDLITRQQEDLSILEELDSVDEIPVLDGDDVDQLESLESLDNVDGLAFEDTLSDSEDGDVSRRPEISADEDIPDLEELPEELEEIGELDSDDDEVEDELEELETDAMDELEELEIGRIKNVDYDEERIVETAEIVDDMYSSGVEPEHPKKTVNPFMSDMTKALSSRYIKSNDTYRQSLNDEFANVDNVFAEELCLGGEYTATGKRPAHFFDIKVVSPSLKVENDKLLVESDIMELESESENDVECSLPETNDDGVPEDMQPLADFKTFSLTRFGDNIGVVAEIQSADVQAIVENNGVFSISASLSYTDVVQDPVFKSLVDSVLHK